MQSKAKLVVYAKINEESAFSERLLWARDRWHFTSTTLFTHSPYEPYEAGISDFTLQLRIWETVQCPLATQQSGEKLVFSKDRSVPADRLELTCMYIWNQH